MIPCSGGSDDYEFEFKGLAKGWSTEGNRVSFSDDDYAEEKYYGIKCKAFDRVYRQFIKRAYIFSIKGSKIVDAVETDYEDDVSTEAKCQKIVK